MALRLFCYFIIGGTVITLTTFFGSKGQGLLAAFITQFPSMTLLAFYLIYRGGGKLQVIKYAKGFLFVVPPWIIYILSVVFLCDKIGPLRSLLIGIGAYSIISLLLLSLYG